MNRSIALSLLLIGLLGVATGPRDAAAARHEVSGTGRFSSGDNQTKFRFDAQGGPSRATGFAQFTRTSNGIVGPPERGEVTCLKVQGDRMVIAGEYTIDQPFAETKFFVIRAEDNGKNKRNPRDQIAGAFGFEEAISCADFNLGGDLDSHRVERGDITIN